MTDPEAYRFSYAELVRANAGGCDARIVAAFRTVSRELFLGRGPWRVYRVYAGDGYISTPSDDPSCLYQDVVLALDETRGINNGLPSLHARCLNAVLPLPGETVVHVGSGSGYYSAILARLVGRDGVVEAFEIEPDLAGICARNLAEWPNVNVQCRSGLSPLLGPADVIYVNAGLPYVPTFWLDALGPDGRLIFPLTPGRDWGAMLKVTRCAGGYAAAFVTEAAFISCAAEAEPGAADALAAAFGRGGCREVRSLRRAPDVPDKSRWLAGRDWWLSTAAP